MKERSILIYMYGRILGVNSPEEMSQYPISDAAWKKFNEAIIKDSFYDGVIDHDKERTE